MAEAKKKTESLVTIENKRKRMLVFNLAGEHMRDHPVYGYQRITQYQTVTNPRTGAQGQKRGRASVPSSITFCAREKKVNLPHEISVCPEVKAAKDRGDLRITYQDEPIELAKRELRPNEVEENGIIRRKTALELQEELKAAAKAIEDEHAKSELVIGGVKTAPRKRNGGGTKSPARVPAMSSD